MIANLDAIGNTSSGIYRPRFESDSLAFAQKELMPARCGLSIHSNDALSVIDQRMRIDMVRSSRDAWESKHRKSVVDFLFRSYLQPQGEHWPDRHRLLSKLAGECGDFYSWTENVFIGENRDRQYWMIFAFKFYEHKVQFDAGIEEIMTKDFGPVMPGIPLPNGLANPDRDLGAIYRRKMR